MCGMSTSSAMPLMRHYTRRFANMESFRQRAQQVRFEIGTSVRACGKGMSSSHAWEALVLPANGAGRGPGIVEPMIGSTCTSGSERLQYEESYLAVGGFRPRLNGFACPVTNKGSPCLQPMPSWPEPHAHLLLDHRPAITAPRGPLFPAPPVSAGKCWCGP